MQHIDVGTKFVERGLCDSPPHVDHRLSIHVGQPVASVCWERRPRRRWFRTPGGINIVPAGAQSLWFIEAPMEQLLLRVPYETFTSVAVDLGLDAARVQLDARHEVVDARIEQIGHVLRLEMAERNPNGRLFVESFSEALCVQLIRQFSLRAAIEKPRRVKLGPLHLARVAEHIEEHLGSENLSLQELSAVAGTSVSYFKAAFKQAFGKPVHRYVVERRVERAVRMLAEGAPISFVAAEVGFAHASHMARWMRRLLRTTPSQLLTP